MMELTLNYSPLKIKVLLCAFSLNITLQAQEFEVNRIITIEQPAQISVDKQGAIYLASVSGSIDKYNKEGELESHFSPMKIAEPKLLEAWNPLKIFTFYQDFQEYSFLDRFLTTANRFSLTSISSYIGLATISNDNNIWLVDLSDFSLKKYDVNFQEITIDRPLDLVLDPLDYELTHMKEYQNLLFISDRNRGLLLFDNLGNYLRTISIENVRHFNFYQNKLYYIQDKIVSIIDIYTNDVNSIVLPLAADFIIQNQLGWIAIKRDKMLFLREKN